MIPGDPDAALLARAVEGDGDAFSELMHRHEDRVFAVCLRITGDREAALDAAQETFLTLFRKGHQYRGAAAVSTWLYRVAVNSCYDQMRRSRRRPTEPLPEQYEPADPGSDRDFELIDSSPAVEAALAELSPEFRAVIVLGDINGYGLNEMAEMLEIPVGTVKSRLFRARRQLAPLLGNHSDARRHPSEGDHD
jgi:RNA polymerase sigma-70 factor (ECF subfamily)